MEHMHLPDIDIHTLLPQQEPFVMVSSLQHYDEVFTRTELNISENNIFVENGELTEFGILENIAQTCATRTGYVRLIIKKMSVDIGLIGAVRNFSLHARPKVGDVLKTQIEIKSEIFNITLAHAKVWIKDQLIAECEMKISE